MRIIRFYHTPIALFLLALFSLYTAGCSMYIFSWKETSLQKLENLTDKPAYIYVKDCGENPMIAWRLTPTSIRQDAILGKMQLLTLKEIKGLTDPQIPRKERRQTANYAYQGSNRPQTPQYVMLTLKPNYAQRLLLNPVDSINPKGILKVEIYQYDKNESNATSVAFSFLVGIPMGILILYLSFKNGWWVK